MRNTQRELGFHCPSSPTRLASIDPMADPCFDPRLTTRAQRWTLKYPLLSSIKTYLLETLETTLELLTKATETDEGLYFFRLALAREDQIGEQFIMMAQALGLKLDIPPQRSIALRDAITVPACIWQMGASKAGFAFDNEWPQHEVRVPEFEIDAQPVSWAQYAEFVDDGGYDKPELWSEQGRAWLAEASSGTGFGSGAAMTSRCCAPRYVEQIGAASGAVLALHFGQLRRLAGHACVMHVNWHEANAYARWAKRRLPTEVEWEICASRFSGQGYVWGDVWEWTSNTFRAYPGFVAGPWAECSTPHFEHCKTLPGASWATRARMKVPTFRGFARPTRDAAFVGFRTCAL